DRLREQCALSNEEQSIRRQMQDGEIPVSDAPRLRAIEIADVNPARVRDAFSGEACSRVEEMPAVGEKLHGSMKDLARCQARQNGWFTPRRYSVDGTGKDWCEHNRPVAAPCAAHPKRRARQRPDGSAVDVDAFELA